MFNELKEKVDAKVQESLPFSHRWHNNFHIDAPFGFLGRPWEMTIQDGVLDVYFCWNPMGIDSKTEYLGHIATREYFGASYPELVKKPDTKELPFSEYSVFYRGDNKYFAVGGEGEVGHGHVLVYKEEEKGFRCLGELKTKYSETGLGYRWEYPNVLKCGTHDVLLFCSKGVAPKEFKYQSLHQSGYLAGHISLDSMEMYHGRFQELDRGFDFYAPKVLFFQGRHIMVGWIGMPDCERDYPTREKGWVHSLTMPRTISLRQGHIYSRPLRELRNFRIAESATDIDVKETAKFVHSLGEGAEILMDITYGQAKKIDIEIIYGLEKLVFSYDKTTQVMVIDREGMVLGGGGKRRFKLYSLASLSLQMFVDRSVIEVFFQHGEEVSTIAVFPQKNILPEMRISSETPIESISGRIWELAPLRYLH